MEARAGQSLVETCLVMLLLCLVFASVFQVSRVLAAKEILSYTATCTARAKTVGFNRWMVRKVGLVAAIPNAGRMVESDTLLDQQWDDKALLENVRDRKAGDFWSWVLQQVPVSDQYHIERARIPDFLYALDEYTARNILDYKDWDTVQVQMPDWAGGSGGQRQLIEAKVKQNLPLWVPMHRAFYARDDVDLEGKSEIESHYELYLEDQSL